MKNIIEIKNLTKSFGGVKAVDNVSFGVREGDLFAFLGVNGAGKSTTINIMCGTLSKDSGSVLIDGRELTDSAEKIKSELGVVFQGSVLDSALSVYDNLISRAALYGITGEAARARIAELAEMLDFGGFIKRAVGKLQIFLTVNLTLLNRPLKPRKNLSKRPYGLYHRKNHQKPKQKPHVWACLCIVGHQ